MSMATLERAIVAGARVILKNPKLKQKDILQWSTAKEGVHLQDNEVMVRIPDPGVWIAVDKKNDRRTS